MFKVNDLTLAQNIMPPRHQQLFGVLQVKGSSKYISHFLIIIVIFEPFLLSREITKVFFSFMKILETVLR